MSDKKVTGKEMRGSGGLRTQINARIDEDS